MTYYFQEGTILCSSKLKRKYDTTYSGTFAYERTNNWYYWQNSVHANPIVHEEIRASSYDDSNLTPLTINNNWPEKLSNASIFPYLLPPPANEIYKELYNFIFLEDIDL